MSKLDVGAALVVDEEGPVAGHVHVGRGPGVAHQEGEDVVALANLVYLGLVAKGGLKGVCLGGRAHADDAGNAAPAVEWGAQKSICGYTGTFGDFMDTVECEVFLDPLAQYKTLVGLPGLTAHTWLQKNYARLGNYSQFADQDMVPVGTEQDEERVKVTYNVTYVKHSSVSVNCKTKKSICGYTGTFGDFMDTLEADSFVEAHGHEQPEYVY